MPVWDLTTDTGTFIAEGIVVHNCDELDWKVFEAVMGQPMSRGMVESQTVICSTLQNADGTLAKVLQMARERGWPVYVWGWEETVEPHGWLTRAQVARKRGEMTAESWRVEVELGEPRTEGLAIFRDKVERMFVGPSIAGDGKEFGYREFEPPVAGAHYTTGADWARTQDFVEMVTLRDDVYPLRLVAYQRFRRRPTAYIVAQFEHQTIRYPGAALHDITSLGGHIMDDLVTTDAWETTDRSVSGFDFGRHRARQQLFTAYIIAIESEEIVSPRIQVLYDQHRYVRNEDLRSGGTGHPPDGFVAAAMAHWASRRLAQPLGLVATSPTHGERPHGNGRGNGDEAPVLPPTGLRRAFGRAGHGDGGQ